MPLVDMAIILVVKPKTVKQLAAINQSFYERFAVPFAESRSGRRTQLDWVVRRIPDGARVLDVGCGAGDLAERLEREGRAVHYVGIDGSRELVQIALNRCAHFRRVTFDMIVADLMKPDWHRLLPQPGTATYDCEYDIALALAVLHHLPGRENRERVLNTVATLIRPGGQLVMTNWQFLAHERMRKKIIPWATVGLAESELEPGDALLHWKRGGSGSRYCHQITALEVEQLASSCGLRILEQFTADEGMNLCTVLRKEDTP